MPTLEINPEQLRLAAKVAIYRKDFERFGREQLKIKPKAGPGVPVGTALAPFTLNPPQQVINAAANQQVKKYGYIRIVALKARQPGYSTWSEARGFHITALNPNVTSLVIAQDDPTAQHIFTITKLFYDCLDPDIKPMARYTTKRELVLENPDEKTRARWAGLRSKIHFQTARNIHAGTGQTINVLHASEAAKYQDAQTVFTSVFPSVPLAPGTIINIESTAFPTGDWFHEACERARSGKDVYEFVFAPWYLSPEYVVPLEKGERLAYDADEKHLVKLYKLIPEQIKFRRWKIQEGGGDSIAAALFDQEYPHDPDSAWISTDLSVFDLRKLYEYKRHLRPPERTAAIEPGPRIFTAEDGELSIWEEPEKGQVYDIGVDVATGVEDGDWSVAEVINRKTRNQVAEYRAHISPIDFAGVLYWLGKFYNRAQIAVEVTGIGFATNEQLQRMGYEYTYIWRYRGKAVPTLSTYSGWETGDKSKKLMVSLTRHLFLRDELVIRSQTLWNEMRRYAVVSLGDGREQFRASEGHDDAITAYMIALVASDDESYGLVEALRDGDGLNEKKFHIGNPDFIRSVDPAFNEDPEPRGSGSGLDRMVRELRGWR